MTDANLVNDLVRQLQQRKEESARRAPEPSPPLLPLIERLRRLITSLSPDERQQPHSIEFFAERLRGRTRPTPNRGEIGLCLTQLGYTRSRQWRKSANGFRALWHPPEQS